MGACVLHLKCFLTSSLFCLIRLSMWKSASYVIQSGGSGWRIDEVRKRIPFVKSVANHSFDEWEMAKKQKWIKCTEMTRPPLSSPADRLFPSASKNFAKANGDTEIIRNFAPDGHSVYGLWHVSVQRDKRYRSRLNFYEIQDLPLFLRRFGVLKRECSELYDRWKVKKRPKRKVKMECRRTQTPNQIFVRKVQTTS